MTSTRTITLLLCGLAAGPAAAQERAESEPLRIRADVVYVAPGQTVENGLLTLDGGQLGEVAAGPAGSEDDDDDGTLRVAAVTAGLVDASARLVPRFHSVEQSSEITPSMRVSQAIDPFDPAWRDLLEQGITAVLIAPYDRNVIGGLGVVVKTGGEPSVAVRTVKPDAVLRGAMGGLPSQSNHPAFRTPDDFYSRRPTTRMGVEWEWRKAFFDAAQAKDDPSKAYPGHELLLSALRGEIPVMIDAWATQDIRTAIFLKEEMAREGFGSFDLILDSAAEAWVEMDMLVRSKAKVVLPPFGDGRTNEGAFMPWNVAKVLHDAGVSIALSGHGEEDLALQAAQAMRGGLSHEAALAAVTIEPARMLGVADRVGTLEAGKDADLVLWSGKPLEPTSRVIGVVLGGELVVDPRGR